MMPKIITETSESGVVRARYIISASSGRSGGGGDGDGNDDGWRTDIILPKEKTSLWASLLAVFLPAGYPHSVTDDYMWYQIYDSLQAFSSSIAGLLSSRAVLEGVGVGDASASPTAAILLSVLQESMGRVATILFAHKLGTSLEPECKMYRLAADIFNDSAMVLDCLSPALPKTPRVVLLGVSSVLRALCGVAAGSSKASLSAHFAKWGNLGELNAKDSSQETVISLMGMLVGSVVVARVSSPIATWSLLLLLLSIHLVMNYAAVRAVSMQNLNQQRANIVLSTFFDCGTVLTPNEVSNQERIFEWGGFLRWKGSTPIAKAKIGGPLQEMISSLGPTHSITGAMRDTDSVLVRLFQIYANEEYLLWYSLSEHTVYFVLKNQISVRSQLKAWAQGLVLVRRLAQVQLATSATEILLESVNSSLLEVSDCWPTCMERLRAAGWDLDIASLETASGTRINVDTKL